MDAAFLLLNETISRFPPCKDLLTLDLKYYEKTHCKYKIYLLDMQEFLIAFIANLSLFVLNLPLCADLYCYYINNLPNQIFLGRLKIRFLPEICRE